MPNNRMQAKTVPAAEGQKRLGRLLREVEAVVFTVSVADCAVSPLMVTEAGTLHVGRSLAVAGEMAQLRLTVPVKPYHGVTEIVAVFPVVAPGTMESGAPVRTEK
jgi:hypothetical protein